MTNPTSFAPIELTEAELNAVSGACHRGDVTTTNSQTNGATVSIVEQGGSITIDGNGVTINGNITLTEFFNAMSQVIQTNMIAGSDTSATCDT